MLVKKHIHQSKQKNVQYSSRAINKREINEASNLKLIHQLKDSFSISIVIG